jgi:D-3-phosphoglycerate dehydrogenase
MLRVFVVGDTYMRADVFVRALKRFGDRVQVRAMQFESSAIVPPETESERRVREYACDASVIARHIEDADVLLVQGAIVTDAVLDAGRLRLVGCARGGPVNVDMQAATERCIPVVNGPGKNAQAVGDFTIALVLSLFRNIARSSAQLRAKGSLPESVFDGVEYFGREMAGSTIGLIGLGNVGRQVATRALALGMKVVACDPLLAESPMPGVVLTGLPQVLAGSDVVSLHARADASNKNLLGPAEFGRMREGAYLINTARESLIDEDALLEAVRSGKLRGAALDVMNPAPPGLDRHPFLDEPNILITPHIGGATAETLDRGAAMMADAVEALLDGRPLPNLVNPEVFSAGRQ